MHRNIEAINIQITPVMNLFVVLIPFLLISAAFIKLAAIDTTLPKIMTSTSSGVSHGDDELILTVKIVPNGFQINKMGAETNPKKQTLWTGKTALASFIPLDRGKYNFKALNLHMLEVKRFYPGSQSVVIFPDEMTSYDTIVNTMDATREIYVTGTSPKNAKPVFSSKPDAGLMLLFPNAVLGHESEK